MKSLLWVIALAGCTESTADNFAKPPPTGGLSVELAAVTLGDDCAPVTPPTAPKSMVPEEAPAPGTPAAPAKPGVVAPGRGYRGHCDQTTMQLVIKAPKAGSVKIKKVELLDTEGKPLQTLESRNARHWTNPKDMYQPWDEKVAAGSTEKSMYDLTSPDWNKLTNGRWSAHTKSFQVRVVVEIGGANKTVTKSALTATRLPPAVPT